MFSVVCLYLSLCVWCDCIVQCMCVLACTCICLTITRNSYDAVYATVGPCCDYPSSISDCSIRIFYQQVYALLEYFSGALN